MDLPRANYRSMLAARSRQPVNPVSGEAI
jgi:hypothetical protein